MNTDSGNESAGQTLPPATLFGGWRDMESAPKSGSILVYRGGRIVVAHWCDQKHHSNPKPYWESETSWTSVRRDREQPPTAWMPLPNPPNEKLSEPGAKT